TRRPAARASSTARALRFTTLLALTVVAPRAARAQTLEDAELLRPRELNATVLYGHDAWSQSWEGDRKRSNDNIGTLTTSSVTTTVGYGASPRLTLFASLPYVKTEASEGVLEGMSGRQDLTLMAKYRVLNPLIGGRARLKVLAVGAAGLPTSDYTPDFLPMSIGVHSKSVIARGAAHLQDETGWFFDGYAERMWRSNITLNRVGYYANDQWIESNEVAMPDVAEYRGTIGWQRGAWCVPVGVTTHRTLGGSDIRRQDMPFASNRMNFTMAHAELMYFLPGVSGLRLNLGAAHTISGRNVGQSTTIMTGLTYALHL
ncbi:MAG TPA: hypothetical protein VF488_11500, partial [Gemmatimonadaceae bacterium]